MENKYIIDRIEGKYVICEDENRKTVNIDISNISGIVKSGKVILRVENGYYVDEEATTSREEEIKKLMKGMWEE